MKSWMLRLFFRTRGSNYLVVLLLLMLSLSTLIFGADPAALRADRAAIERVYYNHRTGQKPTFAQSLPPAMLDKLVRQDLKKEGALQRLYRVEVTPAMLAAEVQRINTTTRAPDVLAEIKAALGNNPTRFANAFAKPILVERLLRDKFDNDDALHAGERRQAEETRNNLLAAKQKGAGYASQLALLNRRHPNAVTEATWQMGAPPTEAKTPTADEIEIQKRFGPNAQILSSTPAGGKDRKFYFEDLPGELQNVLRVQLRKPGDVSAVIETPGGFLLYVAKQKTDTALSVAGLSLPKRSYEDWVDQQKEIQP